MKIGIFDSGIGGLNVVNQLLNYYKAHIVYVADTANMPYGNKSPEEIIRLSERITQFLIAQDVECIVIACHTISAIAGPYLAAKYTTHRFVTMLEAVIPAALHATLNNRIGIMATPATINNQLHKHALQYLNHQVTVIEQACPTLAPAIEHQLDNNALIQKRIAHYVSPLIAQEIDTLILGCTHYDVIEKEIQQVVGDGVKIVGSGQTTIPLLKKETLGKSNVSHAIALGRASADQLSCFVSDQREAFADKLVHIIDFAVPVTIQKFSASQLDLIYH